MKKTTTKMKRMCLFRLNLRLQVLDLWQVEVSVEQVQVDLPVLVLGTDLLMTRRMNCLNSKTMTRTTKMTKHHLRVLELEQEQEPGPGPGQDLLLE